jgi:cell wall-associated NlpC family hydrolase
VSVARSPKRRLALALAAAAIAALAISAASVSAPQAIEDKRSEAEAVLAQIQQIDAELEHVVDDYNSATERLEALEAELRDAKRHVLLAKNTNKVAQKTLSDRLVALYVNGGESNALEVILGAESLDDLLDRVDAANRVSDQDSRIVAAVRQARASLAKEQRRVEKALAEQKQVVAQRAAQRDEIEAQLAERQALYSSIEDQIQDLIAEEKARQERLAREAQRRLEVAQQEETATGDPAVADAAPTVDSSSPSPEPVIQAPPPGQYGGVAGIALQYLGTPYVWAGASPAGFDCSGFVQYVFGQVGVSLPHNAAAQYGYGAPVPREALQSGDLVFFNGLGHVGIYIGGGQFVHSPHSGDVVKISSIYDSWYASTWVGAKRL